MMSPLFSSRLSAVTQQSARSGLLLALCCALPVYVWSAEPSSSKAAAPSVGQALPEERSHKQDGFAVPPKGPLVSELSEKLDPDSTVPETVIRRYEEYNGLTVREYLINGTVFQIEVTPANGPPYYLIDVEGRGLFQERYVGFQPRLVVPQWVLLRF
ncbi:DUF2782 domain-containing protein [Candidatus Magnetaquicoccus inordinatus]|uniref:DUF2782 domain-containing protein n=1 Tax=Candidatus Magnetaquicoccus inordinatus TaxID=2496818 RepID=UPI00187D2C39|nr:DUF2782 domain-containing protein [Candidatus Magnetaquicoccus inordinatus]